MSDSAPFLLTVWRRVLRKDAPRDDPYGQWYVDKAYVAAEVELDIGLVTTALILIYQRNVWLALGTLVGFLILEFLILAGISMAENVIRLRRRMDLLLVRNDVAESLADLRAEERHDDADPYKLLRIAGISTAVTCAIVLYRSVL
ncbi:MAG: hypothetical protein EA389_12545 [Ilumatobacter sp.]|nr:MAG: hypothetical protein EA389_12545 [Ilumatobacter sp.]